MAVAQLPLQYSLDIEDDLLGHLCTKGLKVVEVFAEWCGPCRSVLPTLKKIRTEKDDEAALTFLTIPAEKCQQLESAKEHKGKSEPLFLMYRNGQLKAKVYGADTPSLSSHIHEFTPANAEVDDLEVGLILL
eukprot:jgi/Chrzof1/10927/Cz05g17150.t1_TRXD62